MCVFIIEWTLCASIKEKDHFCLFVFFKVLSQIRSQAKVMVSSPSWDGVCLLRSQHCYALCHLSIWCLSLLQPDSVTDIFPARILARQKTLRENSDLYVTCSTLVAKRHRMVYVYLCKDGHGIKRQMQKQDQDDSTFTISSVGLHHSGSYSCVYSIKLYLPSKVAKRGSNIIQILVIGKDFHSYESIMPV